MVFPFTYTWERSGERCGRSSLSPDDVTPSSLRLIILFSLPFTKKFSAIALLFIFMRHEDQTGTNGNSNG